MIIVRRLATNFNNLYEQESETIVKLQYFKTNLCAKYSFINCLKSMHQTGF